MKAASLILLLFMVLPGDSQITPRDVSATQLQAILDLPLDQAILRREPYKKPVLEAYTRQMDKVGKDCLAQLSKGGQQSYNACMGQADQQADEDYAAFYNNLQMLCHQQDELKTLKAAETIWRTYRDSALKAVGAAWSGGSGASGFYSQVDLSLVRDHMKELREIYGLNIAQ